MNNIAGFLKPALIAVIILYGSTVSKENLEEFSVLAIENIDKAIHFVMYFALNLALLKIISLKASEMKRVHFITAFTTAVLYGICMELAQLYLTEDRSFEATDIIANTAGAAAAMPAFRFIRRSFIYRLI